MSKLTEEIKAALVSQGADLVGIGDLSEMDSGARNHMPIGICVAVKYPAEIIRGISVLPTAEYFDWYNLLNKKLDGLVTYGAELLQSQGYAAIAQTRAHVGKNQTKYNTTLPHKTVATRAGVGWIGKSALLVTREYGSMIRISTILTDAPLEVGMPINASNCGACTICTVACPAHAISGKSWSVDLYRDEFFNPVDCRETARKRSFAGFGQEVTICGKCIEVCPHTKRYLNACAKG